MDMSDLEQHQLGLHTTPEPGCVWCSDNDAIREEMYDRIVSFFSGSDMPQCANWAVKQLALAKDQLLAKTQKAGCPQLATGSESERSD